MILTVFNSDIRLVYIPSLGSCTTVIEDLDLGALLSAIVYIISVILTVISTVNLCHKIIRVKGYKLHQCNMDRVKSQRLKELIEANNKQ